MVTREDVEGFLDRLAAERASFSEVEPGLWILKPGGDLDFNDAPAEKAAKLANNKTHAPESARARHSPDSNW